MAPLGIGKRLPAYVPEGGPRDLLLSMSKADLAELVWDYAVRMVGEDAGVAAACGEISETAEIIARWNGRRRPRAREGKS